MPRRCRTRAWYVCVFAAATLAVQLLSLSGASASQQPGPNGRRALPATDFVSPGWSSQSPIYPASGGLVAVTCPTTSFCLALDSHRNLVQFNGTSWGVPQLFDSADNAGTALSCASIDFCVASDLAGDVLVYNGSAWTVTTPLPDGDWLPQISCAPETEFCAAIDAEGNAFTFDGSSWSDPTPLVTSPTLMVGVSCSSASFCMATDNAGGAFAWDGTSWSATGSTGEGELSAVSCLSSTFCVAGAGDAADFYDGTSWTVESTGFNGLSIGAMSCSSESLCAAVAGGELLTYNGVSWMQTNTGPFPVTAVSCAGTDFCMAVDEYYAFEYQGTWGSATAVDLPGSFTSLSCPEQFACYAIQPGGEAVSFLDDTWQQLAMVDPGADGASVTTSCSSETFCVAVDYKGNGMVFDGASWGSPTPVDAEADGGFVGEYASCVSGDFCMVVDSDGYAFSDDANAWAPAEEVEAGGDFIGVSCADSTFCVAIDEDGNAFTYGGSSWSGPVATGATTIPTGISCAATTYCVVTAGADVVTYDGSGWEAPVAVETTSETTSSPLAAISCPVTGQCVAAGGRFVFMLGAGIWTPLELQDYNSLTAVSCPTTQFCEVVDNANDAFMFNGTTVGQSFSVSSPVVGQPVSVTATVSAITTGQGAATPNGSVNISDGSSSCRASLSGSDGVATGSCDITPQRAGTQTVSARFSGQGQFGAGASTKTLDVGVDVPKVALTLAPPTVIYGNESTETLGVTVSAQYAGTPTGAIKMIWGGATACSIRLKNGTGSCDPKADGLAVGSHDVVAEYGGDSTVGARNSAGQTLAITKANASVKLKLSSATTTLGDENIEVFSITVAPQYTGSPSGSVEVMAGSKKLCKITLKASAGSCSPAASVLRVGTYSVDAVYGGNIDFEAAESNSSSLTVERS